jgi:hypothetical protein
MWRVFATPSSIAAGILVLAAACVGGESDVSMPVAESTVAQTETAVTPTPPQLVVTTLEQAPGEAAPYFVGPGPPLVLARPRTVSYAETTVGEARRRFEPDGPRTAPEVADDVPAWVFVAHGEFQTFCMGCEMHYSPIYDTVVVVIPKDGGRRFGLPADDADQHLRELAVPEDVPSSVLQQICDAVYEGSSAPWHC